MKRKLLYYGLLTLAAGTMLWACRKEWRGDGDLPADALTTEQARAFFENSMVRTKAGGGYLSAAHGIRNDLSPGDLTPRWENARSAMLNGYVDGVDVEIDPTNRYSAVFRMVGTSGEAVERTVGITQKLVVNRWRNHPRWLGLYAYIATVIPTPGYYATHKNLGRTFVNLGDKKNFSGFVIYHTLEGAFVNADRYEGGKLVAQVYNTGSAASDAEATTQMLSGVELLGGMGMFRGPIESEEVTITACIECKKTGCKCKENGVTCICLPEEEKDKEEPKPPVPPVPPVPPGGGEVGPIEGKVPPIRIKTDDCNNGYSSNISSAKGVLNMASKGYGWNGDPNPWSSFLSTSNGADIEYGLSMYRTAQSSGYIFGLTKINPGTANSVGIQYAQESSLGTHTIASFHSHTNGLPPSGLDVMQLCQEIGRPEYNDVYVITGSGSSRTVYTLHVENRDALVSSRNSIRVDPNTNHFTPDSEAGHHYNEAMARFEGSDFSAADRMAYSLAYALEKCNCGIQLLRGALTPNATNVSFEQIQMTLETDATNLKNCK